MNLELREWEHPCYAGVRPVALACAKRNAKELAEHLQYTVPWNWPTLRVCGKRLKYHGVPNHTDEECPLLCMEMREGIWTKARLMAIVQGVHALWP